MFSLSAYLYIADSELAHTQKRLSKPRYKSADHVSAGQLGYVYWINAVRDSMLILRRHSLLPQLSSLKQLRKLFPPLAAIIDQFNSKDKASKKKACNDVIEFFFGSRRGSLLGTSASRLFSRQSFYNEPSSILIYLKLFHAYALWVLQPQHKDIAFLVGGRYYGCKNAPSDRRDSLYLLNMHSDTRQVVAFNECQLISNLIFLAPQTTAASLFETKANVTEPIALKDKVEEWKKADNTGSYVGMPKANNAIVDDDDEEGGQGGRREKVPKKGFRKQSFKEPMGNLSAALTALCSEIDNTDAGIPALNDVLNQHNILVQMTTHGAPLALMQKETDANVDIDEKNENSDSLSTSSSDSSDSNASGLGSNSESEGEENSKDNSSTYEKEETQKEEQTGDENAGSKDEEGENMSAQSSAAQPDQAVTQNDKVAPSQEPSTSVSTKEKGGVEDEFSHSSIIAHMKVFETNGVTDGGMRSRDITAVLGLRTSADFRSNDDKKFFCSIKSKDMQKIKDLYEARADAPCEKPWMGGFVKYLKQLKTKDWANSIIDLPEQEDTDENGKMADNLLLLWKEGKDFQDKFFPPDEL